ncbi:SCY1-like protein 2 isoform X2 [Dendronephthya gigantea]|uniref:SCY1-like protein 2 isoform X2 n=1 Tax=Dendronephthya gigantea TaxID=151771 RepID=UPI00106B4457|nr:SCY1-like protein 2 isoform X2 [Dendronephthya gigantea]
MLDRLKKSVTSVIGNPVTREYETTVQRGTCGPGSSWKIYDGRKKSTGQEVSVFIFEKKMLEKMEKKSAELILETMRSGPTHLARLRHPRVLVVQHPMEESRDSLAFATEPVFSSLSNILGNHENFSPAVPKELKEYELYDVEKVYGLYQIVEGVIFLHNDARRLHGNLTPESIVITKNGQWKIAGLHFSKLATTADKEVSFNCQGWESQLNPLCQPELNYTAPEHILSRTCTSSADLFSLGMLICAVYNGGKPLFDCQGDIVTYKRHVEKISRNPPALGDVPAEVSDQVKCLLSVSPEIRPDAHQISKVRYFDNVAAQTLHYLDTLMQRDNMTKSQFFKSLYKIISMLPKRVVIQRILPHLCLEFSNHAMIPFVLPNVLLIAESCSDEEYNELIFPKLKLVLKIQDPIQVVLILLKKMDLLLTKTPKEAVQFHVLPMVFQALEAPSDQVQELALTIIPSFAKMIEYSAMKHSIIPRIKTLCLKTETFSVRVNCLVCLGKIMEFLDKFLIIDEIFPLLLDIPTREPAICMAILGIYKQTMLHKKLSLDKDYIAKSALPFLLPLAVEPGLNISQFTQFMSVIREMVSRVETEQKGKLQQLKQMQEETKSSLAFAQEVQDSKQMDDLMGKVTHLFSANTPPKTGPKEIENVEEKNIGNGSAAFNKFFGFADESQQSQNTKELQASLKDTQTQNSQSTKQTSLIDSNTNQSAPRPNMILKPNAGGSQPNASTNTLLLNSTLSQNINMVGTSTQPRNQTGLTGFSSGQTLMSPPIGHMNSLNVNYQANFHPMGSTGISNTRNGGMFPGNPNIFSNAASMRSSAPANASSSLHSLEFPGFQSNQSQSRTLNQMKTMGSTAPSKLGSYHGQTVSTNLSRPGNQAPQFPGNQNFNLTPTLALSNQNSTPEQRQQNNTDLLDIFG